MKKLLPFLVAIAVFGATPAFAQMKVGIVDMNKVFTSFYKTKEAETRLNDARAQAKTDLDGRLETLKSNMEVINKLEADTKKPELAADKKDAAIKQRDEKINEVRNLDREIGEFRQTRERQLQEQFMRMRGDIVQDIMKIVDTKVKAENYDIVLDSSGLGISQVKVVLYSAPSMDFSDSIITELNKSAPKKPAAN
ncbi:MAG: OmpH family outer membrane protein [Chthoniobacterales bacterium]|jgi:outer membrane protein|nr:OmpH family outer membrane protein [Chthoniobacterales bacterium]